MKVRLSRHAVSDLQDACDHYAEADPALRDRFLADLDLVVDRMETFPNGAPPVEGFPGLRRARMRQFPFGVFYRVEGSGDLVIIRVLHTKQDHVAGPTE